MLIVGNLINLPYISVNFSNFTSMLLSVGLISSPEFLFRFFKCRYDISFTRFPFLVTLISCSQTMNHTCAPGWILNWPLAAAIIFMTLTSSGIFLNASSQVMFVICGVTF